MTDVEDILRGHHAQLAVLVTKHSEMNRRLGIIEKKLDEELEDGELIAQIKEDLETRKEWWTWLVRLIGGTLVTGAVVAAASYVGWDSIE